MQLSVSLSSLFFTNYLSQFVSFSFTVCLTLILRFSHSCLFFHLFHSLSQFVSFSFTVCFSFSIQGEAMQLSVSLLSLFQSVSLVSF